MLKKILIGLVVAILVFCAYVSTRPGTFHYERSGVINASAEKIFPYLNSFKLGYEWSPYMKADPNAKFTYSGPESGTGSKMTFDGNNQMGSGKLEITKDVANSSVELTLEMLKPFAGFNNIKYMLTPEGTGTRFTWSMSGEGGFMSKLMSVVMDCDKMIGGQFEQGIQNLKTLIEAKP